MKEGATKEGAESGSGKRGKRQTGKVWVLTDEGPKAVTVKVGLSDGAVTEIVTEEIQEGESVIVGDSSPAAAAAASATTNPFAPQGMPGGGQRRGGR
jgi:HlyD family secretion protein